jgi:prefoldin subunit 5
MELTLDEVLTRLGIECAIRWKLEQRVAYCEERMAALVAEADEAHTKIEELQGRYDLTTNALRKALLTIADIRDAADENDSPETCVFVAAIRCEIDKLKEELPGIMATVE